MQLSSLMLFVKFILYFSVNTYYKIFFFSDTSDEDYFCEITKLLQNSNLKVD